MEFVQEVTAYLENKPGRLAKICSALAQEKVDIQALSVMETEGPSVLRFITSDLETTKSVLTSLGTEFRLTEVLAVQIENRTGLAGQGPGAARRGTYQRRVCLRSTMAAPGKAVGIFHTSNPKRAAQVLGETINSASSADRSAGPSAAPLAMSGAARGVRRDPGRGDARVRSDPGEILDPWPRRRRSASRCGRTGRSGRGPTT